MTKPNIIILLIVIITFLVVLCLIIYKYKSEKLENMLDKLEDSEDEIIVKLKKKLELLKSLTKTVETKYKVESKIFEDINEVKIDNIDSFKNEELFNKCYQEIKHIREDNSKVRETKAFKEELSKYDDNEINIISLRTFHNKYTLEYNNMLNKFPYNIIAKIKKYKIKDLIEGKELDSNFNNDLEV